MGWEGRGAPSQGLWAMVRRIMQRRLGLCLAIAVPGGAVFPPAIRSSRRCLRSQSSGQSGAGTRLMKVSKRRAAEARTGAEG